MIRHYAEKPAVFAGVLFHCVFFSLLKKQFYKLNVYWLMVNYFISIQYELIGFFVNFFVCHVKWRIMRLYHLLWQIFRQCSAQPPVIRPSTSVPPCGHSVVLLSTQFLKSNSNKSNCFSCQIDRQWQYDSYAQFKLLCLCSIYYTVLYFECFILREIYSKTDFSPNSWIFMCVNVFFFFISVF